MTYQILIVEDDAAIRESLTELLEVNNFRVRQAVNGKKGLEEVNGKLPDLILCDIKMPIMDGYEFLINIRKNAATELIPVIMITAKVDFESKLHGLELGVDDYITKPFEFKELFLKVTNLLNTRKKIAQSLSVLPLTTSFQSQDEVLIKKLKLIIEENIERSSISVEDIAKQLFMSTSTFQRKIKCIINKTPNQFIKEYRLKRAKSMIQLNYGTLSEIAFKTGFTSLSYFSASYKNFFGHNPKADYQKQ